MNTRRDMASDLPEIEGPGPEPVHAAEPSGAVEVPPKAVGALWYRLTGLRWRTLAVVAPGDGARAWRTVQALAELGERRPPSLKAVNVTGASMDRVAALANVLSPEKLGAATDRTRFLLAVDSPLENPAAIGLLSTCDGVVLLLERRRTRIPDGQRIIELVGRERFIGAVLCSG